MTNINMNCSFLIKLLKLFNYKSNKFQVAVHLFSSRSQLMTLEYGKNKKVTHMVPLRSVSLMFLAQCYVFFDLLLNRPTAWNLFVLYD